MKVVKTISQVRENIAAVHAQNKTIGFVPTMGSLHEGHISLIKQAGAKCDYVVVSIFVNPTQFGPAEDFEKYPRDIEKDLRICSAENVDMVFTPSDSQMYPTENLTWVNVEKLTEPLCGLSRPGHFKGVTTVCAKLFNIVMPDVAFFGQKDAQQAIVIKKMVKDLNMPLKIRVCPTVREPDGLAMSSRNQYLTANQRKDALLIYKSLKISQNLIEKGGETAELIIKIIKNILEQSPKINIEYISVVDADTLEEVDTINKKILVAVAVKIGNTRLIDNILVDAGV